MCLSTITETYKTIYRQECHVGYKVVYNFDPTKKTFRLPYFNLNGSVPTYGGDTGTLSCDMILRAEPKIVGLDKVDGWYATGFHIFTNRADAKIYTRRGGSSASVVKVFYWGPRYLGTQNHYNPKTCKYVDLKVVIADAMVVPSNQKSRSKTWRGV